METRWCRAKEVGRDFTQLGVIPAFRDNRERKGGGKRTHRGLVFGLSVANLWKRASKERDGVEGCALMMYAVSLSYSSHCSQPPGSFSIRIASAYYITGMDFQYMYDIHMGSPKELLSPRISIP